MIKPLIYISLYLFTLLSSSAKSPEVPRINTENFNALKPGDAVFEADIVSYEKAYMINGVQHKISKDQLRKLKTEAYALPPDKIAQSPYMQIRICHIICLKVTKVISGTLQLGDIKNLIVSDSIDLRCPHFANYEIEFIKKPHLVWMFSWQKDKNGISKQTHAIATVAEFNNFKK